MRFLFTVKYLFQSNFSPLNVLYYLKDLKDRARAAHVAINILPPLFPTRSRDLLTYCGAFTAGGRGLPSDCSPPEKERQLKKSGNPSFKQPSSGISNSLFLFFSSLKRKHEIRARPFPPPFPPPPRGTWVFTRGNKSLGDKPRESHPHLLERFYFLQGNRLFEVETARLVRNRDYTGNGIGITKRNETFFSKRASIFLRLLWVVVQGVDSIRGIMRNGENNGGLFTR